MNIVVIGGGASGLISAIYASRCKADVVVLEQNNRNGQKLLATGNGRCNITNSNIDTKQYRCVEESSRPVAAKIVNSYSARDAMRFFSEIGVFLKEKNGWIYPLSGQSSTVLQALEMEAHLGHVKLKTCQNVIRILSSMKGDDCKGAPFIVQTEGWSYQCDRVILACGSMASQVTGSTQSGYYLAQQLGHSVTDLYPALVPIRCHMENGINAPLGGVRAEALATLYDRDKILAREYGEVQFTDYGLSGIPIFQFSSEISLAASGRRPLYVSIDFLPDMSFDDLENLLQERFGAHPSKTMRELLIGMLPDKVIAVIADNSQSIHDMACMIKDFHYEVSAPLDMEHAQVCLGGVSLSQIDADTMESRIIKGLYICGELLDAAGPCGGYNLQWAWSTGAIAGMHAGGDL